MKICVMLMVCSMSLFAQINYRTNFADFVDSLITDIPATEFSNEYKTPQPLKLNTWGNVIQYLIDGDYAAAEDSAEKLDYNLYRIIDNSVNPDKDYYALVKKNNGTNYWGMFFFNPSPSRSKLFIQSPHPKFDTFTGKQGALIFKNLGCRALFITGTHRCNNDTLSTCAGKTSVCNGSLTNYQISDQAHVVNGTLQRTTIVMNDNIADLIVIQPHGFQQDPGEPDLIMSNGTQKTPSPDYLSTLKTKLLDIDNALTFKIAHIDTTWTELIGTTNTQGRLINGSNNPCSSSASTPSGRFLHIEQAYHLRSTDAGRLKLTNALAQTFPDESLPVELSSFSYVVENNSVKLKWITITEINNYGFEIERMIIEKTSAFENTWNSIGFVRGAGSSNVPKEYSFSDTEKLDFHSGKVRYRLKQIDNDGASTYSSIITVNYDDIKRGFTLFQNYPNPFNSSTNITFYLPEKSEVKLDLYNILGQKSAAIENKTFDAGYHSVPLNLTGLESGVYFYRIITDKNFSDIKKLTLLK